MTLPGFVAEAGLNTRTAGYRSSTSGGTHRGVVPQSKMTCAFKAGRLAGRCLAAGFDHQACMDTASDFNSFCNEHDL